MTASVIRAGNMVKTSELTAFLDSVLEPGRFKDATYNGLQFEGIDKIEKAGFAVDLCRETVIKAARAGCGMLVVHHGLIWGGMRRVTGMDRARTAQLIENNINLYVSHLPLDIHPEYGHNALIIKALGAGIAEPFNQAGYYAAFSSGIELSSMAGLVRTHINPAARVLGLSSRKIRRAAVCSGSIKLEAYFEACDNGADVLLTGECSGESQFVHPVQECGVPVIAAGHTETEVFGIRALMGLVGSRFDLKTVFIANTSSF